MPSTTLTVTPAGGATAAATPMPAPQATPARRDATPLRRTYLTVLTWSFSLLNTLRLLAYLPTLQAIHASGDSSQHSLWTWAIWFGANATMAAWLIEQHGGRLNRAALVSSGNALMCLAAIVLIVVHRW